MSSENYFVLDDKLTKSSSEIESAKLYAHSGIFLEHKNVFRNRVGLLQRLSSKRNTLKFCKGISLEKIKL